MSRIRAWLARYKRICIYFTVAALAVITLCSIPRGMRNTEASSSNLTERVLGFLTTDGRGLASHPFSRESTYGIKWAAGQEPIWTALPVWVSGDLIDGEISDATVSSYDYVIGTNDKVDAYYNIVTSGAQKNFEIIWSDVYNKLNNITEFSEIDTQPIADIITYIHGDERYGTLIDVLTDGLMLLKEINENGASAEYDYRAYTIYTDFYRWLSTITVHDLEKYQ